MNRKTKPKTTPKPGAEQPLPRTISFQPNPAVREVLEKVRKERGLKDRTTLINEAIVAHYRAEFGKRHQEEIAPILARIDAKKEKAAA